MIIRDGCTLIQAVATLCPGLVGCHSGHFGGGTCVKSIRAHWEKAGNLASRGCCRRCQANPRSDEWQGSKFSKLRITFGEILTTMAHNWLAFTHRTNNARVGTTCPCFCCLACCNTIYGMSDLHCLILWRSHRSADRTQAVHVCELGCLSVYWQPRTGLFT